MRAFWFWVFVCIGAACIVALYWLIGWLYAVLPPYAAGVLQ